MKIVKILAIVLLIFLSSTNSIFASQGPLPCRPDLGMNCDDYTTRTNFGIENISNSIFNALDTFMLPIVIVMSIFLSVLIYRQNKKDKELGFDRSKFNFWNNLLFTIILLNTYTFIYNTTSDFSILIIFLFGFLFSYYTVLISKNVKVNKVMFIIMLLINLFMLFYVIKEMLWFLM